MRYSRLTLFFALCLSTTVFAQHPDTSASRRQRLTDHVYYLASDSLKGRRAGSENAAKAAEYIRQEYEAAGLKPYFKTWEMPFRRVENGTVFTNIVGVIEGNDPLLKDEYIVLGAHYDHLGIKDGRIIYNGADDNASGTAALIEVARMLKANESTLKRSVIIAAFDAEELGLYGSNALAKALDSAGVDVKLMMSVDMVGWLKAGKSLQIEGVATIRNGKKILKEEAARCSLAIDPKNFETSLLTATDTEGFALLHIPTLAITTGLKSPYHPPEDDADLIDYEGLDKITDYIAGITMATASQDALAASGRVAAKHTGHFPYFEMGVTGGIGSSRLTFDDAAFIGRSSFSAGAGVVMQFNYKYLGLQVGGIGRYSSAPFPDNDDPFGKTDIYKRKSVLIPATLLLQYRDYPGGLFVGAGGYYGKIFEQSMSLEGKSIAGYDGYFNRNEYGLHWCVGLRLGRLLITDYFLYQLNGVFPDGKMTPAALPTPGCQLNSCIFTVSYML